VKIIYCQLQATRTPEKIATDAAKRKEAKNKADKLKQVKILLISFPTLSIKNNFVILLQLAKPVAIIAAEIAAAEEKKAAKAAAKLAISESKIAANFAAAEEKKTANLAISESKIAANLAAAEEKKAAKLAISESKKPPSLPPKKRELQN